MRRNRRYDWRDTVLVVTVGLVIYACAAFAMGLVGYKLNHSRPITDRQGELCPSTDITCSTQSVYRALRNS